MNATELSQKGQLAKEAARKLAVTSTKTKNHALQLMAEALDHNSRLILEANALDLKAGQEKGLDAPLLDRLSLDNQRIQAMIEGLNVVKALPDRHRRRPVF